MNQTTQNERKISIERDVNVHFEDRKRSRHFFWFMWIIYAVAMMSKSGFTASTADIVSEGFMTKQETSFITMMFYVVYTPLQILGGIMSDKFSPERLIQIGLLGAAASNTVIFFNQSYYVMMGAWIFNAASQFALWAAIFKVVSSQCVRSDRNRMIFLISLSPSAGILLSYIVAALLPRWQLNFAVSAISLLALLITLIIWDKHINKYLKWDKSEPVTKASSEMPAKKSTFGLFYASGFIFVLICVFFRDTVAQSSKSITPTMLTELFNTSPSLSNLLNIIIVLASVAGIVIAKLCLHFKLVKNSYKGIIFGNILALLATVFFIFANNTVTIIISLCFVALLTTTTSLFTNTLCSAYVRYGKNATAAGLLNAAASLGFFTTAGATMSVAEQLGWDAVKIMLSVLMAISILFIILALPLHNKFTKTKDE